MIKWISKAYGAGRLVKELGFRRFANELVYRASNYYHESRLRVTTDVTVTLAELGIDSGERHDHMVMGYPHIWAALRAIPVDTRECTFLDLGCGMGRAIVAAATLPYRQVIGVEISDRLLRIAEDNIGRMRCRKAEHVRLFVADAACFEIPESVNVMYFYNPFRGQVLEKVVENIQKSVERTPRSIHIIFFNNDHFDGIIERHTWIRKIWQKQFYPHYSCGAYLIRPSVPVGSNTMLRRAT